MHNRCACVEAHVCHVFNCLDWGGSIFLSISSHRPGFFHFCSTPHKWQFSLHLVLWVCAHCVYFSVFERLWVFTGCSLAEEELSTCAQLGTSTFHFLTGNPMCVCVCVCVWFLGSLFWVYVAVFLEIVGVSWTWVELPDWRLCIPCLIWLWSVVV